MFAAANVGRKKNSSNAFTQGLTAMEGLRPSFSAHVSWREHGAPVRFCLVRWVRCVQILVPTQGLIQSPGFSAACSARGEVPRESLWASLGFFLQSVQLVPF